MKTIVQIALFQATFTSGLQISINDFIKTKANSVHSVEKIDVITSPASLNHRTPVSFIGLLVYRKELKED